MDIYGFMVAGFLVTMGTLGDRIGRRKLLMIGAAAFGLASIFAAYSTSPEMLIVARAALGIAGATLGPSTLALISNMFPDPRQRSLAIGVWLVCFIGGGAVGPVVGGAMLQRFWWGSVFLLGVPAMVLLLAVGRFLLPEYRDTKAGRIDLTSVALSLAAILPLIYGLKELAHAGLAALPVAAVLAGLGFGVVFVRRQQTLADPLLDLRLFSNRAFTTAIGSLMSCTLLMGATMVFVTQYLQLVAGLTPLSAGLWMLPGMICSIASFQLSPLVARKIRPAFLIGGGLAIAVIGLLVITQAPASNGLGFVVTGFALLSLGAGPLVTLGTDLVVGSAPPEKAGSAAAINETGAEFGFALGIAVMGTIATAIYRGRMADAIPSGIPSAAARAARDTLAGAVSAAHDLPSDVAAALLIPAREGFTNGLHVVALIAAVVMIGITVLAVRMLRHVEAYTGTSPEDEVVDEKRAEIIPVATDELCPAAPSA
jgi:DHA2 family multidrug resistance protein-like MFS transporter